MMNRIKMRAAVLFSLVCFLVGSSLATSSVLAMPEIQAPRMAAIERHQKQLETMLYKNGVVRRVVQGVVLLGVSYAVYTMLPSKERVKGLLSKPWVKAAEQVVSLPVDPLSPEEISAIRASSSLWRKSLEIIGCSTLGFFATQQLEKASASLAQSIFFPVTLQWFIEHKHKLLETKNVSLDGSSAFGGAQEVTITRSAYLEEIEKFIKACTESTALSSSARDTSTYFVITGMNSFMRQLEAVAGFMGYKQAHVVPAVACEMRVTREALLTCAETFCAKVQEALAASYMNMQEKKGVLLGHVQELRLQVSRLLVDRFYRLEAECA